MPLSSQPSGLPAALGGLSPGAASSLSFMPRGLSGSTVSPAWSAARAAPVQPLVMVPDSQETTSQRSHASGYQREKARQSEGSLGSAKAAAASVAALGLVRLMASSPMSLGRQGQRRARLRLRRKVRGLRGGAVAGCTEQLADDRRVVQVQRAAEDGDDLDFDFSAVDALIKKSRSAAELGIDTLDWHEDMYDGDVPKSYLKALNEGVDMVDVKANSDAMRLLRKATLEEDAPPPRYCLRITPRPLFGLGLMLNGSFIRNYSLTSQLTRALKILKIGSVDTLVLEGPHFAGAVYDAVTEAYEDGLCTRIGFSHPNANVKTVRKVADELRKRGVYLSCVFLQLSLLDRKLLPLAEECRDMGLQVFANQPLGDDELASGRFTPSNPTGGEIGMPRFTLAQLMPLQPFFLALETVASMARARCERPEIDTAQVALQWISSKGASPILDCCEDKNAKAIIGCKGWALVDKEVAVLDEALKKLPKLKR
eukprot:TRINITY_DN58900_c0_g1_i1.p1 TRINITY_DN58900_c0_g1~~TRINITY_DN58900_c0_g1_i1.p1  ORF type:complete len:483 (+),score=117.55 TRINITY_DN58900_c0_g1_i1:62-1510(+)